MCVPYQRLSPESGSYGAVFLKINESTKLSVSMTKRMSEADGLEINGGRLQDFTIDQLAGAIALSLGAVGTLLLVIWQSRCVCKCRLGLSDKCYLFDCSREPPPVDDTPVEDAQEPAPEPEPEQIIP
jgi:hypothetical protein